MLAVKSSSLRRLNHLAALGRPRTLRKSPCSLLVLAIVSNTYLPRSLATGCFPVNIIIKYPRQKQGGGRPRGAGTPVIVFTLAYEPCSRCFDLPVLVMCLSAWRPARRRCMATKKKIIARCRACCFAHRASLVLRTGSRGSKIRRLYVPMGTSSAGGRSLMPQASVRTTRTISSFLASRACPSRRLDDTLRTQPVLPRRHCLLRTEPLQP